MSENVRQAQANVVELGFSTSASIAAGQGVLVGQLFGVAEGSMASTSAAPAAGAGAQIRVRGVVQITKTGTLEVGVGDTLYWDDTNKVVNKTAGTNKEVGFARTSTSDGSAETTCEILLNPTLRSATGS